MSSGTLQISVPSVARSRPRPVRLAVPRRVGRRDSDPKGSPAEGSPVFRLVGVALLGWFGLMTVVAVLAIY